MFGGFGRLGVRQGAEFRGGGAANGYKHRGKVVLDSRELTTVYPDDIDRTSQANLARLRSICLASSARTTRRSQHMDAFVRLGLGANSSLRVRGIAV